MDAKIVVLAGDGIGPEVTTEARKVLEAVGKKYSHNFTFDAQMMGGNAIDALGTSLPDATLEACRTADAILLGAVGGPKWDDPTAAVRPEQGLLGLRKVLGLYANLRPLTPHPALRDASPLRPERLEGVDMMILRELTGGVYFGEPRERRQVNGEWQAVDTMVYTEYEIERVAHLAFQMARERRGKVTSVDKANVLECSRLWRQKVVEVAEAYPDVTLEHVLVDAASMHLISRPATFDVMVTANLFGDILTDEASMLTGSMGNLPSASLGEQKNQHGRPRGIYEPIHGSAPDIAGQGIANPVGMILSLAMLLRHSLGLEKEATAVEAAVDRALLKGYRTADLGRDGERVLGTGEMTEVIVDAIGE